MADRRWTKAICPVLAASLVAAASAGGATAPRLSLVSAPSRAVVGTPAAVVVASSHRGPVVWIKRAGTTRTFGTRAAGKGRYRASVTFPAAGRWTLGARVGKTSRTFRGVTAAARAPHVREPFRVVLAPDGSLLVPDGAENKILRVDPAHGRTTAFAGSGSAAPPAPAPDARTAALGRPLDVAVAPDGDVCFVSDEKVWRIDAATFALSRATETPLTGPTAIAFDTAGDLFVAEFQGYVRRIDAATGAAAVVAGTGVEASTGDGGPATAAGIDRPHGLAVAPDGAIWVADTYGNRLRRFTVGGSIETVATVSGPTALAFAADRVYVSETFASRIGVVDSTGTARKVADVFPQPTGVLVLPGGKLVVSLIGPPAALNGKLVTVDPATGAVADLTH